MKVNDLAELDKKDLMQKPSISIVLQLVDDFEDVDPIKCNIECAISYNFV